MDIIIAILAFVVLALLLAVAWIHADRRYLRGALKEARADRTAQYEENSRLRAEMIASTHARTTQITDMTTRLRGANASASE